MGAGRRGIVLIGMRRSGKTTVGRLLAERLAMPFRDLDDEVARRAGSPAGDVIAQRGESAFRRLEEDAVAQVVLGSPGVLAAGGGTPLSAWNRARLGAWGRVLYLRVGEEELRARGALDPDPGTRPPLVGGGEDDEVAVLLSRRHPLYVTWADAVVDGAGDPEGVTARCESVLRRLTAGQDP